MPETKTPEEIIAEILRDNITFSGQVGGYVIHGAIEKIMQQSRSTAIGFARWADSEKHRPSLNGKWEEIFSHPTIYRSDDELFDLYLQSLNNQ